MWDDVTAGVVLARLALPGESGLLHPGRGRRRRAAAGPAARPGRDPRVPVLALIDARLAAGETDGWHYDDLPEDAQAWRDTLRFLDEDAQQRASRARLRASDQRRAGGADPSGAGPELRRRELARLVGDPRLEPVDPLRLHRVLLPPLGLERDRLPRPGLPPRLPQPRRQRPRALGSPRHRHRGQRHRPGHLRRPRRTRPAATTSGCLGTEGPA